MCKNYRVEKLETCKVKLLESSLGVKECNVIFLCYTVRELESYSNSYSY